MPRLLRALALSTSLTAACSPAALPTSPNHPAAPTAPIGRVAPAPPALAPGVAGDALSLPAATPADAPAKATP